MHFKIGEKVILKYTSESGLVHSAPDMGIVQVKLDSEIVIPVNMEDLLPFTEKTVSQSNTIRPKVQSQLPEKSIEFPKSAWRNTGVSTAFIPKTNKHQEVIEYDVFLINDSQNQIISDIKTESDGETLQYNGFLNVGFAVFVGKIQKEALENHSTIILNIADVFTSGIENAKTQSIKLKPKSFFSKEDVLPLFDTMGYVFKFQADPEKKLPSESLKDFTEKMLQNKPIAPAKKQHVHHLDPIKRAVFTNELDLHVEAISEADQKLDPAQILHLQMAVFDRYIAEAIRLGVEKVYIVHGIGTGRLKSAIAKRLSINPYVLDFKNEYLASYGFGATEVKLR